MEFLCPNGHRIQCSDEFAGKAANCPKCGIRFEVPPLPASPLPPTPQTPSLDTGGKKASDSDIGKTEAPDGVSSTDQASAEDAAGEVQVRPSNSEFEFLCPNGHRLQGPLSLQGYPGQCPECGSKFRIPEANLPTGDTIASKTLTPKPENGAATEKPEEKPKVTEVEPSAPPTPTSKESPDKNLTPATTELTSIAAEESLFETLCNYWSNRGENARMEIHTDDGGQLSIESFDTDASNQILGVFSIKGEQDTLSLTIIPFAKMTRIVLNDWQ